MPARLSTFALWVGVAWLLACAGPPPGPEILVATSWEGASAEDIELQLVEPQEQAITTMRGLASMHSVIEEGRAAIHLSFEPGVDGFEASSGVREALQDVDSTPQSSEPPTIRVLSPRPLVYRLVSQAEAEGARETLLTQPGVRSVDLRGATTEELVVAVDPTRLAAFGLGTNDLLGRSGDPETWVLAEGVRLTDVATVYKGRFRSSRVRREVEHLRVLLVVELDPDAKVALPGEGLDPSKTVELTPPEQENGLQANTLVSKLRGRLPRSTVYEIEGDRVRVWLSDDEAARSQLADLPGVQIAWTGSNAVDLVLLDATPDDVLAVAAQVATLPGVLSVTPPAPPRSELSVELRREALARYGIPLADVQQVLAMREGIVTGGVRVRWQDDDLLKLQLPTPNGAVPLSAVADIAMRQAPAVIHRVNGQRATLLRVGLEPGATLAPTSVRFEGALVAVVSPRRTGP